MSTLPFYSPKFRAFDANGDPLAGGKLYSYAAETTDPLDTFTTRAGDVANDNPVILDANGEADVWTTPGVLYSFVLANSLDVIQWTVDNVPSGAAESSSTDLSGAVDPGGRLTLASGTPISITEITNASAVLYVPHTHAKVPLYDGTAWTLHTVATELSQALSDATKSPAAAVADKEYDMFVWVDAGTLRVTRGPAWSLSTVRGTGAGTTELVRVDGRYVNAYAISNGPGAQRGLYVGTIRVDTGGGVNDNMDSRHVWNAYHRERRPMLVKDSAASWAYSTDAWRAANGNAFNRLAFVVGLPGQSVSAEVLAVAKSHTMGTDVTTVLRVGIGLDASTISSAGLIVSTSLENNTAQEELHSLDQSQWYLLTAKFQNFTGIGAHSLTWLERALVEVDGGGPASDVTWYGQGGSVLANSGITGSIMA